MHPATVQSTTLNDAPAYWFLNTLHVLLAKSQSTGGAYSLIHLTATPGFASPYHLHHMEDEAFYVLDGEFTFFCDGEKTVLGTGRIHLSSTRSPSRASMQQRNGVSPSDSRSARR